MEAEILQFASRLAMAVETVMNPAVERDDRLKAHQLCEEFKESSPFCAQCGLLLASKDKPHVIRNFGLQLIEHCVKYRWNAMSPEEKSFIKDNVMALLASGSEDILTEQSHIKNVLSRIVVEMVKREWPQHWSTLLSELDTLCKIGPTQVELVLLIFLRLAEDVVAFQNFQTQRRREIHQALTGNMSAIYSFMLTALQEHVTKYKDLQNDGSSPDNPELLVHCKVAQAVLMALTGYLDWISWSLVFANNDMLLLQYLCLLLSDSSLQLHAAECLLIIVNRKGKLEDRKPLLALFSEGAMSTILSAAQAALHVSLNEYYYQFLKKLCQVLTGIGTQLCALWGSSDDIGQPENFGKYLEAILALTQHPSQMLGSYTHSLLASFLKHEHISKDPVMVATIDKILSISSQALMKVGFPSHRNHPSCDYARLDFDCDEDFNVFFSRYRAEVVETLRLVTLIAPDVTFQYTSCWLQTLLQKPLDLGDGPETGHCNLSSPAFLEWDALVAMLESVMSRLKSSPHPQPPVTDGIQLFKAVLNYQTQDPLILSCLLSCISALFTYITYAPDTLPTVLDKIFTTVLFNLGCQTKATRSRAVKNVRRHACSSLVKICKQFPELLLPGFDQLYTHIKKLSDDPAQLSQMEKCTLMESLILISNEFKNYDKQSAFLADILAPVREMWLSQDFREAFWSTEKFMSYIGIDRAPVEPSSADTCGINRSHILYCISTILAVLKRSTCPAKSEVAASGGFVLCETAAGAPAYRNPATAHILPLLVNLLALLRVFNELWFPQYSSKRHPEFYKAYDLQETEKLILLGIQPPFIDNTDNAASKDPLKRMQGFINSAHDNSYHILGNCCSSLGYEFYRMPDLAQSIISHVFHNLEVVPDYRLRPIIRVFLKPYIHCCPKEEGFYTAAIIPLLETLAPFMMQRLEERWHTIHQRAEEQQEEDDNPESQEVVEDQLTRQLTREYIDLIACICLPRRFEPSDDSTMEEDEPQTSSKEEGVSELGMLVLKSSAIWSQVVLCVFTGLTWRDTNTCNKCINCAWPLLKQLVGDKTLSGEDAKFLFHRVLTALQIHGEHEACQSHLIGLGLQAYEALRPSYPGVTSILEQVPQVTPESIKDFDDKFLSNTKQKQASEKRKKDAFKKLVSGIIGQNIGQQFRKDTNIKNLPPVFKRKKPSPPSPEGLAALFNPEKQNGQ
ncbi:exportin-5 [Lingula anatina]|uniref:Exportin-5 n=1 Tax=Lingula anatina TaxID=7574 RepID=A0A1S3K4E6_LINAN|nr:exportin-5 [Lingula anatina]|eukprot:XP_013417289.1 exportin-5 [Lingula anatina]